jgi:hypothetical protein
VEELEGCQIAECLMRADGVVDLFPLPGFAIKCFHFQYTRCDLVRLNLTVGDTSPDTAMAVSSSIGFQVGI